MNVCLNCNFRFERGTTCPRCASRKIKTLEFKQHGTPTQENAPRQETKPMVFDKSGQRVYGDTKAAWKSFHNQIQTECPKCGGKEFSYDHKHKEKTCLKCGEILFMPRRPV